MTRIATLGSLTLLLVLGLVGCAEPAPAPPPASAEIELTSPAAAVRSFFGLAQASLAATAARDTAAANAAVDQIQWHIAAHDAIAQYHRSLFGEGGKDATEAVRNQVESWLAMINYYADGIALADMHVLPSDDAARRMVVVPARGPDDEASIRIRCIRDKADHWRVRSLELAAPIVTRNVAAMTQPATQPATQPTPAAP